ncbi:hypothetical protein ACOMCU_22595 [Lysinibacillus sp. UGB7]|uniref:hypothetical protein n=1 Tax=Lysinibacillus sp. UGB7 TaxID=3411039 RepID=UPI003B7C1DA7
MKTNTLQLTENDVYKYNCLIENCNMIEPIAKTILSQNPFKWVNIVTRAFDFTVKGNSISTNSFATYIANCSFIKFIEIIEKNEITLAVEKGMLVFLGTGDIEEILLDSLFNLNFSF